MSEQLLDQKRVDMSSDENIIELTESEVLKLRKSWEIEEHWILRRDFILCHKNKFSFDRLLCLAQLFINIEILGNEYDPQLMKQIAQLAKDVNSYHTFRRNKASK